MRVALLVPGGVDRSGTERVIPCLLWLIERLARAGDDVCVYAMRQERRPGSWPLLGAKVWNAGARPRRLRMLAKLAGDHARDPFDVVHAFWARPQGVIGAIFARMTGIPFVLTLPGGDLTALPQIGYGGRLTRRGRWLVRVAVGAADRIFVPSASLEAQAGVLGIRADRLPLGVALDRWPVRPPQPRTADVLRLLHVASLNRVKDQPTLLAAMGLLYSRGVSFVLDVIGEDTLGGAVQRLATASGLDGVVRFRGQVPHAALRPWMERADLLVVTSYHEAGPIVALEAAIAGVPTVGTAVGHLAEWAHVAALPVPVGDAPALADAIVRLSLDEPLRLELATRAQRLATTEDADWTANQTRRAYAEAIEARAIRSGLAGQDPNSGKGAIAQ